MATFIWTSGEILNLPFNNSIAINLAPDNRRGDYMSWYWMTWSLTNILAPLIGFSVADEWGFEVLWIGLAFIAVVSFLIMWWLADKVVE